MKIEESYPYDLSFWVSGDPKPAGSKSAYPYIDKFGRRKVHVVDSCKESYAWKAKIRKAGMLAIKTIHRECFDGPIQCKFSFFIKQPRSNDTLDHIQKPDALKLCRAAEDALTGVIWNDDAQIVKGAYEKQWTIDDEEPGVEICVHFL